MNDKYYAICELDKNCNINHVFVDTISSNYENVKLSWHHVNFRFALNSFITFCAANNRYKQKHGYYKYGIKEIDMNKINLNKYPNYQ